MTEESIQPGPELDGLVAERVMGCIVARGHDGLRCSCDGGPHGRIALGINGHIPYLDKYSTDITAAFEVLDHLSTLRLGIEHHPDYRTQRPENCRQGLYKPVIQLNLYEHDDDYNVTIGRCKGVGMDDDISVSVIGRNFKSGTAWVICLAALKVVTKYKRI